MIRPKTGDFFSPQRTLAAVVVCSFYTTWSTEDAMGHTVSCSLFREMVPNQKFPEY